jgi:methyl-accepting chemotaxis protein
MKLRAKLLLLPAIGGVSLLAVCALVTMMQLRANRELETLADVRFSAYADAYRVQGELASIQAEAYRTLLWVDTLQESVVRGRREALSQRNAAVLEQARALRHDGETALNERIDALSAVATKYGRALDDALDAALADRATGVAAMQTADAAYAVAWKLSAELVEAERLAASASVAEAKARDRLNLIVLWAATLASLLVCVGVSLVFNRRLLGPLEAAREAADAIAAGNLRVRLPTPPADEIGQLISALRRMAEHLSGTIGSIKRSSEQIATASTEIAMGNTDLSRRTEQQAASLQQTSSSMAQLTATVATNADNARQANQLALGASEVARRGGEVVENVVATMGEISESSRKIADIISVIDGIAFQTNILALNAAVEAARAGEQGRGFAVVAGEVRTLAQRSADAARQIKGLITDSVGRVESGSRLVKDAGETMAEIVTSVRRVTDIIGEISSATGEQSTGIGQVDSAVGQLDRMTQQNAALVEQSAAAADSLRQQARLLAQAIDAFRLDEGASRAPAPVAPDGAGSPEPPVQAGEPAEPRAAPPAPPPAASGAVGQAGQAPGASTPAGPSRAAAPSRPAPPVGRAVSKASPVRSAAPLPSAGARPVPAGGAATPSAAPVTPPPPPPARPSGTGRAAKPAAGAREAPAAPAKPPDEDWEEF